jgi:hypothetical protein
MRARARFVVRERRSVDMGGFDAELQAFALPRQ